MRRGKHPRSAERDLVLLNDAAGDAFAGVASRLGFEIVRIGVNDHSVANDGIGSVQRGGMVNLGNFGDACSVGNDVAQVAHVTLYLIGRGMGHLCRIIMSSSGRTIG